MRAFSVKRAPLPLAWMVALFLAGVWPTMARAQGVAPPGSAPANAAVGDPPPRLAVDPSDGVDFEEPGAAVPKSPVNPAYPPRRCQPGS